MPVAISQELVQKEAGPQSEWHGSLEISRLGGKHWASRFQTLHRSSSYSILTVQELTVSQIIPKWMNASGASSLLAPACGKSWKSLGRGLEDEIYP